MEDGGSFVGKSETWVTRKAVKAWMERNPNADIPTTFNDANLHKLPAVHKRFWERCLVADSADCWEWVGPKSNEGYGLFNAGRIKKFGAHRVAYILLIGEIPNGLVIDHLCRNRACVNPSHMEPVTTAVNVMRGVGVSVINSKKTHCIHGHSLTPENVWIAATGKRTCKQCSSIKFKRYYWKGRT